MFWYKTLHYRMVYVFGKFHHFLEMQVTRSNIKILLINWILHDVCSMFWNHLACWSSTRSSLNIQSWLSFHLRRASRWSFNTSSCFLQSISRHLYNSNDPLPSSISIVQIDDWWRVWYKQWSTCGTQIKLGILYIILFPYWVVNVFKFQKILSLFSFLVWLSLSWEEV